MEQQSERTDHIPETKETEQTSVFRRKSLDRISSPEQLDDYIRVASPRMWVVLAAVVIFLAGAVIWSVFGRIESRVAGVAIVDGGVCTVYVPREQASLLHAGDPVTVGETESRIGSVSTEPFDVDDTFPEYAASLGGFEQGEWICSAEAGTVGLADGIYEASVTEESISPISFLTNKN